MGDSGAGQERAPRHRLRLPRWDRALLAVAKASSLLPPLQRTWEKAGHETRPCPELQLRSSGGPRQGPASCSGRASVPSRPAGNSLWDEVPYLVAAACQPHRQCPVCQAARPPDPALDARACHCPWNAGAQGGHRRPERELHLSSFHCPHQLCIQRPVVSDNDPFKSQNQFLFDISGAPAAGWALSWHPKSTRRARCPAAL